METNDIKNCPSSEDVLSSLHHNPTHNSRKKKRTKFLTIIRDEDATTSKPKPTTTTSSRKPDPSTPKITRPCTECGKKFWSWKALFGHMRCHPELQWRGINPPPNLVRQHPTVTTTEEDHEIATCLLMLANAPADEYYCNPEFITGNIESSNNNVVDGGGWFECSSCKKVFGSHQALGGHRASHKNVKGCYANTNNYKSKDGDDDEEILLLERGWMEDDDDTLMKEMINSEQQQMLVSGSLGEGGHKCSKCLRVFSSGQALGGHKRCHWEKMEAPPITRVSSCGLDLNCRHVELEDDDDDGASNNSSGYTINNNNSNSGRVANLDLRLRL